MAERYVALQSIMMPSDTNPHGTIFGGVILSQIDMAGAIAAARELRMAGGSTDITFVTVAMNRVEFKQPVFVGDVVRCETVITRWGRTSLTLHVNVIVDRLGVQIPVTEAELVYVGVNKERQPVTLLPTKATPT